MRAAAAVILLTLWTAGLQSAPVTAQESAADAYTAALRTMQALAQPAYVGFESNVQAPAMRISLGAWQGYATLYLVLDANTGSDVSWRGDYRAREHRTMVRASDGTPLQALSPIFDPTWNGAYNWLRYGLQGPSPSTPASEQQGTNGLRTIAVVTALSPGAYDVDDAGPAQCPSGSGGHHLHLRARFAPRDHPLTDVVIDGATDRFCSMRFTIGSDGLVYAMTGFMELHFGQVGAFWLVTGGNGNIGMQFFGQTYKESPIAFYYNGVAFEPVKVAKRRPPVFTAALFKPLSSSVATSGPVKQASSTQSAPLKTIVNVRTQLLCTTLRENVARAITGLQTNDAILAQSNPVIADMGNALATSSYFTQAPKAQNSVAKFAGVNDIDPAIAVNQTKLMRLIAQVQNNLDQIRATLSDSKRFPTPALTDQDRASANLKVNLEILAKHQEALLNQLNGLAQTTQMQQMIAMGDGTHGAINEGAPRGQQAHIVSTDDTDLSYGDPLDSMDPSTRRVDPTMAGGRTGGPSPTQSQTPQNVQMPSTMAHNPLAPFYASAVQNERDTKQAEDKFATFVKTAAATCP